MSAVRSSVFLCLIAMASVSGPTFGPALAGPPQVTVSVQATDPNGSALAYEWRVTEGSILSASGSTMIWSLPTGPGLHFAYVLVSNGKGGYTERRVAVSTDTIGVPLIEPLPTDFQAPKAPVAAGNNYTFIFRSGYYNSPKSPSGGENEGVYQSGAQAFLRSITTHQNTPVAKSDARGFFTIPNLPDDFYRLYCRFDASTPFQLCNSNRVVVAGEAAFDAFHQSIPGRDAITGRLLLSDGAPCGVNNEFFGKLSRGRATLLDSGNKVISGPFAINPYGHYSFGSFADAASIMLECEAAAPVTVPVPATGISERTLLTDTAAPVVSGMTALHQGVDVGLFLPPPSGKPSDNVPLSDFFLSFKGLDSRLSACRYYQAVGAVQTCNARGEFTGDISFTDWKRQTNMAPFLLPGRRERVATYINRVDLNLTRNHHSVVNGPDATAAYVCNHLGPADETQAAANIAINNALAGRNLVACVAMDYGVTLGVNGDKPFTRFLIFGPSGKLLPSINLDGRREKFVPGVCVACHGGDHYSGHFPTQAPGTPGAGSADIGAHFLPYDTGNFVFSTRARLTEAAQSEQIYQLNQNVLRTSPTVATRQLIAGWYAGGHTLDKNYLPSSWQTRTPVEIDFYRHVYATSCRTCHVAFTEHLNFDHYSNIVRSSTPTYEDGALRTRLAVCGGSSSWLRSFSMPNSLRTLDLFWASKGQAVDQPAIVAAFSASFLGPGYETCDLRLSPEP